MHLSLALQAASDGRPAIAFAREGASVVVADIAEEGVQETARLVQETGNRALAVVCDVRKADDVKAAVDNAVAAFGRIDVAFHNAGVEQPYGVIADITEDDWDRIVAINLRGVFACMTVFSARDRSSRAAARL